jgi:hypothetical protein
MKNTQNRMARRLQHREVVLCPVRAEAAELGPLGLMTGRLLNAARLALTKRLFKQEKT